MIYFSFLFDNKWFKVVLYTINKETGELSRDTCEVSAVIPTVACFPWWKINPTVRWGSDKGTAMFNTFLVITLSQFHTYTVKNVCIN